MAKKTLSARQILADINAGMDNSALMDKYGLSERSLQAVFVKLGYAGALKQVDLDSWHSSQESTTTTIWRCPACNKPQTREYEECPSCGVIVAKFAERLARNKANEEAVSPKEARRTADNPEISEPAPQGPTNESETKPALPLIPAQLNRFKEFLRTRKLYVAVASIVILVIAVALLWLNRFDPALTEPLMDASISGQTSVVEVLLSKGADCNARDDLGDTALVGASRYGHADVVKVLLDKGARINEKSQHGMTALMIASRYGHADVVKVLLDKGARINEKHDKTGFTALVYASYKGHADVVKVLLDKGADTTPKEASFGQTALMIAASFGHVEVVKLLLDGGADCNAKSEKGLTALTWASATDHQEVVDLLRAHCAKE